MVLDFTLVLDFKIDKAIMKHWRCTNNDLIYIYIYIL